MQTPLAIAVLALLRERQMHPYEMAQLLRERRLDVLIKVRAGSLYHTVDRLEREGLVEQVGTQREGNRPERTTYRVTESGDSVVREWVRDRLARPQREFPAYPYALTEAHNLTADDAVAALTQRCQDISEDLADLAASPMIADKPTVYLIGHEHVVAMKQAELAWTRDLIERIERKDFPWDPWS